MIATSENELKIVPKISHLHNLLVNKCVYLRFNFCATATYFSQFSINAYITKKIPAKLILVFGTILTYGISRHIGMMKYVIKKYASHIDLEKNVNLIYI